MVSIFNHDQVHLKIFCEKYCRINWQIPLHRTLFTVCKAIFICLKFFKKQEHTGDIATNKRRNNLARTANNLQRTDLRNILLRTLKFLWGTNFRGQATSMKIKSHENFYWRKISDSNYGALPSPTKIYSPEKADIHLLQLWGKLFGEGSPHHQL